MATSDADAHEMAPPHRGRGSAARVRAWASAHVAMLSLPLVIGAIEAIVWLFEVPSYVLPAPHEVINALIAARDGAK